MLWNIVLIKMSSYVKFFLLIIDIIFHKFMSKNTKNFMRGLLLGLSLGCLFLIFVYALIKLHGFLKEETFWSFVLVIITIIGWIVSYYINNFLHKKQLERTTKIELYKKFTFDLYAVYKKESEEYYSALANFDFLDGLLHDSFGVKDEKAWGVYTKGISDYFYKFQNSYLQVRYLISTWDYLLVNFKEEINEVDEKWGDVDKKFTHFHRNISWLSGDDYKKFHDATVMANKDAIKYYIYFTEALDKLLKLIHNLLVEDLFEG